VPNIFSRIDVAPGHPAVVRIVAPNRGAMTLDGTNTYLVGRDRVWVIDPGPADDRHLDRVRTAAAERGGIEGVLLTHSHADHSAGAPRLDAPVRWGRVSGAVELSETAESTQQAAGLADRVGDRVGPFEVIATPGHARDHVAFALGDVCFCGDLVLGAGSSIVLPDGGGLAAYLDSIERLRSRGFALLCPGHGPWIGDPDAKLASYRDHRLDRDPRLLAALSGGERSREGLLAAVWDDVPPELGLAAALAMEAHLAKLADEGRLPDLEP
jgi:glyoxylase-like metal-dependent hydrolase (beta-lactamase superfamily II)